MKRAIVSTLVILGTLALGIAVGRTYQHTKTGNHYDVRTEKVIPFSPAPISLQYVTKSVGLPILDPGTTILTLRDEQFGPITIYEARRGFQESYPYVTDISVNGSEVDWEDGLYRYTLRVERLGSAKRDPKS